MQRRISECASIGTVLWRAQRSRKSLEAIVWVQNWLKPSLTPLLWLFINKAHVRIGYTETFVTDSVGSLEKKDVRVFETHGVLQRSG